MPNFINGKDVKMFVDSSLLAFSTTCTVDLGRAEIPTTNKDTEGWETHVVGTRNWSMSVDAMRSRAADTSRGFDYLLDMYLNANDPSCLLKFHTPSIAGQAGLQGVANLTSLSINDPGADGVVTYSVTFKGNGPIAKV